MNNWKEDKKWSDRFLPEIKSVLGLYLIGEPSAEEDQERNTDLMVLKMDAVRIACRIRRNNQTKYAAEFTIRAGRPSGVKTELTKIIEGWGDYLFYGFSDPDEVALSQWILGDLKAFRIWFNRDLIRLKGNIPGIKQNNYDNSSFFYAFPIDIPNFIIAQKGQYER